MPFKCLDRWYITLYPFQNLWDMPWMLLSKKKSALENPWICPGKKGSSPATSGRKMLSLASGTSFVCDLRTRKSLQPPLLKVFILAVRCVCLYIQGSQVCMQSARSHNYAKEGTHCFQGSRKGKGSLERHQKHTLFGKNCQDSKLVDTFILSSVATSQHPSLGSLPHEWNHDIPGCIY